MGHLNRDVAGNYLWLIHGYGLLLLESVGTTACCFQIIFDI